MSKKSRRRTRKPNRDEQIEKAITLLESIVAHLQEAGYRESARLGARELKKRGKGGVVN